MKNKRQLPDFIVKQLPSNFGQQFGQQFGQKKSKYGSKRVAFDGIKFHSQKECSRYKVLKTLANTGVLNKLQLQVKFELKVNNELIEKYVADFTYYDKQGNYIVEDTKGFKTADYKRKKKWMKSVHGIEIKEN